MADDKTEQPTPKRISDARKKGQVLKSYLELNRVDAARRDLEVLNRINAAAHRSRMKLRFEAVTRRLNSDGDKTSLALDTPRTVT
jgi:hypothetical protein